MQPPLSGFRLIPFFRYISFSCLVCESLGARPGPHGQALGRRGGWESLTATGRAVSLLVAERLTNGAVARRL